MLLMKQLKHLILFLLLLISINVLSQNKTADSLVSLLQNTKIDIDRVVLLNKIADEYKTTDAQKMANYANQALILSRKIGFTIAEGNALLNLGNSAIIIGDYPKALYFFTTAQYLFENIPDKNKKDVQNGLAKAFGSIGVVFSEQSNYAKALEYYLKSVVIYEKVNEAAKCAKLYNNIGVVYKSQGNDFKALEYFTRALKIQEKLQDPNVSITYTNIGNCYLKQKNATKAFDHYTKAKQVLDKHPNSRALGEWYNNVALYYQEINQPQDAILNWKRAIQTFIGIEDKFGVGDSYLYLGQLYLKQNKLDDANNFALKALALAKEINVLEQRMLSEKLLSDIYTKQQKVALAFEHFKLYSQAKDSLTNEANIRKSVEEEMTFDFEKREVLQQKEIEKKDLLLKEESKRNTLQLFFASLFGLLLFGIAFLLYNRIQLKKNLTLQKELAEYEQKALHLQMNPHFVFNCLGSISSFIVQNGTDTAVKYLTKFSKLMRLTLEYSKESLIPIDKEIESLQNYLELEQLRFNHKFSFAIYKSEALEDDIALPPLLLQPFVENAIIHGVIPKKEKGNIAIDFKLNNQNLICTIEDNGVGFEHSKTAKAHSVVAHKSMALDITQKRLEMIESTTKQKTDFTIEELKNEQLEILGTKVTLHLPIQYLSK